MTSTNLAGSAADNIILIGTNDLSARVRPLAHAANNIILVGTNEVSTQAQSLVHATNNIIHLVTKATPVQTALPVSPVHLPAFNHGFMFAVGLVAVLALCYLFMCYCAARICEKCGTNPGLLIYIPILNVIPLLQAGGLSGWLLFLFFVPGLNLVLGLIMWARICRARGKSSWLCIVMYIPPVNIVLMLYLAFSE
jgi:hypothetical protein